MVSSDAWSGRKSLTGSYSAAIPFSLALYVLGYFGPIYGGVALVSGLANLAGSLWVLYKPTETNAWRMFKVSSPYLFLLFVAMIVDVVLVR